MPLDESGVPVARVGKARGQEHEFFDTIGQSGRLELVKCQFCGLERTRISLRMRDHLARKCPGGIPPDLRQQFLKSLPLSIDPPLVRMGPLDERKSSTTRREKDLIRLSENMI